MSQTGSEIGAVAVTKRTVMLIDDEESVLTALHLLMQALGYNVKPYSQGLRAVEALQTGEECDFLLCDLRMPEINGLKLLAQVRQMRPALPAALMSAHATGDEIAQAEALGVVGFLGKPFTPQELRELLGDASMVQARDA